MKSHPITALALLSILLVGIVKLSFAGSSRTERPDVVFTQQTAPLGLTVTELKKKYPQCKVSSEEQPVAEPEAVNDSYWFPIIGYEPPPPNLLPKYNGFILTDPNTLQPALGNALSFQSIDCDGGGVRWPPEYRVGFFKSKIILVIKKGDVSADDPEAAVEQLRGRLGGTPIPIQQGHMYREERATVFVTYSDVGNIRTIVGLDTESIFGGMSIAYIDLGLWNEYSNTVVSEIKKIEDTKQAREKKTENEL